MGASNTGINGITPADVMKRQELFLTAYGMIGSIKGACESISLNRETVQSWNRADIHGFRDKFDNAKYNFRESLQDLAVTRVLAQKVSDNPTLLIALLNAHWPEKYRPQVSDSNEDAKELMRDMRDSFRRLGANVKVIDQKKPEDE
jgi:hypothetical protein